MSKKPVYSTKDISKKIAVDPERAKKAQGWIEQILGIKIKGDFFDALQDGTILCKAMNKLKANSCKKFKPSKVAFVARNNIQIYIAAAKKYGVPQTDCFETRDLYDKQALHQVINNIFALSGAANKNGYPGPHIGIKYHSKNKRNFTDEQLKQSRMKGTIPKWSQGSNYMPTTQQDGYGIIKTSKDMQKHTGTQSVWEKGSHEVAKDNDFDGYGIIKGKNMDKHTGKMSAWEKGSNPTNATSDFDGYGIIKGKNMDKHTGKMSAWEKGSNQTNTTSDFDGYGIIKGKNMDKHTGVQSNWEKGANQTDNTGKNDDYGIIKGGYNKKK